jgi:site-specific DNA-cytosine methylase
MRPGVSGRQKPSGEAQQKYEADVALAARRAELLDAAREAERRLRQAQARRAPEAELRRLAEDLDTALTAAMRAAYAAQRAEIGPIGYEDRIYRRKKMATPRVHALTAEAERLLTLRETHRLNGIPDVTYEPGPLLSPIAKA